MFDQIKNRLSALEAELARLNADLAEVKRTLSRVLGENDGLRKENDRLVSLTGIAPAFPTKRHQYPNYAGPEADH